MWASKDGKLDAKELDVYLDRFEKQDGPKVGCAFPGFHDIYKEAGTQPSHGYLDPRNGETFRHTLERAVASGSPIVQVATWNGFGEGTCIEPTREHGYRYLEAIQDALRRLADEPFRFRPDDLPTSPPHLSTSQAGRARHPRSKRSSMRPWTCSSPPTVHRALQRIDGLEGVASQSSPRRRSDRQGDSRTPLIVSGLEREPMSPEGMLNRGKSAVIRSEAQ